MTAPCGLRWSGVSLRDRRRDRQSLLLAGGAARRHFWFGFGGGDGGDGGGGKPSGTGGAAGSKGLAARRCAPRARARPSPPRRRRARPPRPRAPWCPRPGAATAAGSCARAARCWRAALPGPAAAAAAAVPRTAAARHGHAPRGDQGPAEAVQEGQAAHLEEEHTASPGDAAEDAAEGAEDAAATHRALEDFSQSSPLEVLHRVGTRARIWQAAPFQRPSGATEGLQLLLHGIDVVRLDEVLDVGPPLSVQVSLAEPGEDLGDVDKLTLKAYVNEAMHTIREITKINPQFREHATIINQGLERIESTDPTAVAYFGASLSNALGSEQVEVLEAETAKEKLQLALVLLKKELEMSQLQHKISKKIDEEMGGTQRKFMLREQLKQLKKELGEDKSDGTDKLVAKFKSNLEGKELPKEAKEAIDTEMEKFSNLAKESQEYQMTRNYLDWLTMDHHGLKEVKDRILELIAVGALRGSVQGKIVCFVGPPGVGKTSIGRSIAEALGREFYRFSVGGLYDVAEIKGHRRTYVGAMPGKIIQCLKKVQTANPLVLIDEIDKLGRGHQGDPASALLELLDPSQNGSFLDHYLDVPVDCSKILFVCTANVTDTIPGPLLDRMEVIRLSGYDLQERLKIAEDYLVPSAMREAGLWPAAAAEEAPRRPPDEAAPAAAPEEAGVRPAPADGAPAGPEEAAAVAPPAAEAAEASAAEAPAHAEPNAVKALAPRASQDVHRAGRGGCPHPLVLPGVRGEEPAEARGEDMPEAGHQGRGEERGDALLGEQRGGGRPSGPRGGAPQRWRRRRGGAAGDGGEPERLRRKARLHDRLYDGELPAGTVTGLAWTSMGGAVLYVEAAALPRSGDAKVPPSVNVTGQLGSVMKESPRRSRSWWRGGRPPGACRARAPPSSRGTRSTCTARRAPRRRTGPPRASLCPPRCCRWRLAAPRVPTWP
ncbi:unnamed protein product [Prorocentrum cordatum]|uniref:Lon N-terminal domain-containing protein n=1 Tax=Prorocentrum cordatum TaxID=2364126 RepID=A0ABN9QHZ2_9DINO|nr:unnamed protein product [Polarella glacialis]